MWCCVAVAAGAALTPSLNEAHRDDFDIPPKLPEKINHFWNDLIASILITAIIYGAYILLEGL